MVRVWRRVVEGNGGGHESTARATDGTGYYAIDGWGRGEDGTISQSVAAIEGVRYTLAFSASTFSRCDELMMRVDAGGTLSKTVRFGVDVAVVSFHFSFVAQDAETALRLF